MSILIRVVTIGKIECSFPRCENAVRACQLVNREYLTTKELKLLQLMGFKIVVETTNVK